MARRDKKIKCRVVRRVCLSVIYGVCVIFGTIQNTTIRIIILFGNLARVLPRAHCRHKKQRVSIETFRFFLFSLVHREIVSVLRATGFYFQSDYFGKVSSPREILIREFTQGEALSCREFKSISSRKHKGTSSRESDKINISPMTCYLAMYPLYLRSREYTRKFKMSFVRTRAIARPCSLIIVTTSPFIFPLSKGDGTLVLSRRCSILPVTDIREIIFIRTLGRFAIDSSMSRSLSS